MTAEAFGRGRAPDGRSSYEILCDRVAGSRRVLDLGCGDGVLLELLARGEGRRLAGVDLSTHSVAPARRRPALRGARLEVGRAQEPPSRAAGATDLAAAPRSSPHGADLTALPSPTPAPAETAARARPRGAVGANGCVSAPPAPVRTRTRPVRAGFGGHQATATAEAAARAGPPGRAGVKPPGGRLRRRARLRRARKGRTAPTSGSDLAAPPKNRCRRGARRTGRRACGSGGASRSGAAREGAAAGPLPPQGRAPPGGDPWTGARRWGVSGIPGRPGGGR